VAIGAGHVHVSAGEREHCLRMIEGGGLPCTRRVTDFAGLGESGGYVIRIRGAVKVRQVAGIAKRAEARILAAGVTVGARRVDVSAGEREQRLRVIEYRTCPSSGRVADGTIGRESRRRVIRVGRLVEVGGVARGTVFRRACVLTVYVTLRACDVHVSAGQWERRHGAVIEGCARPLGSRMAGFAIGREPGRNVIRICCLVVVLLVTTDTRRR